MLLYLIEQTTKVTKEGGYFIISNKEDEDKEDIEKIPIGLVEGIMLFGRIQLTTIVIRECLKNNIPVFFLSIYGQLFGKIDPLNVKNSEILYKQARYSQDENISFYYSKIFILNKIRNSISMIKRWKRLYYENELTENKINIIDKYIGELKLYLDRIENLNTNKNTLRAYEGLAAEIYFNIYNLFLPISFKITGRNKRPPQDKTNALLSLGYTFLAQTLEILLNTHSIHPQFGFFHIPRDLKSVLVLDYMEMFRSWIIDDFVLMLIRKEKIKDSDFIIDFSNKKLPVSLNQKSINIFIEEYNKKFFMKKNLKTIKMIEKDILLLKKSIREENYIGYKGFNLNITQ